MAWCFRTNISCPTILTVADNRSWEEDRKITCKHEMECLHPSVSSLGDAAEMERKRMVQVKNVSQVYIPLNLQFIHRFQRCLKASIFIMTFQFRKEDIFQNRRLDLISQLVSLIYFKKYSTYVILVCLHLYYCFRICNYSEGA